jgi:hypothetical protein
MRLPYVNSALEELDLVLTGDERTAFFVRFSGGGSHLETSSRQSSDDDLPAPTVAPSIAGIDAAHIVRRITTSSDGLVLYFRAGSGEIYETSRSSMSGVFGSAARVYVDGMPLFAQLPKISADAQTLYWSGADTQLQAATRISSLDSFANGRIASLQALTDFAISADELTLYYSNFPYADVFISTRTSKNVPFDVGVPLANVSTSDSDVPLEVTADGCLLYLRSNRPGSDGANDYWLARRAQPVSSP